MHLLKLCEADVTSIGIGEYGGADGSDALMKHAYGPQIEPGEVAAAMHWLASPDARLTVYGTRSKRPGRRHWFNSYALKHVVERLEKTPYNYCSNGALILAAIRLGLPIGRISRSRYEVNVMVRLP